MAKEEQVKDEQSSGGSKKKLFIIIGGAAAAVLVIAVVLVMTLGGGKKSGKDGAAEAKTEKKEGGGHGGAGEVKGGPGTIFPLEPFIVNIYDGQEVRYLKVKVEFEMSGPEVKAEVDMRQAPLRDAILILLTTKTLQEVQDLQGKNQLREEILAAVGKILPPGKITRVYFTDFVVQ